MKRKKYFYKGFTLIELLMVVLIIAILTSVALPKYRIAVAKTELLAHMQLARAVMQAQEAHYASTGKYAPDVRDLTVDLSEGCVMDDSYSFVGNQYRCGNNVFIDNAVVTNNDPDTTSRGRIFVEYCQDANYNYDTCRSSRDALVTYYFQNSDSEYAGKTACWYYNTFGRKLCSSIAGVVDFWGAD